MNVKYIYIYVRVCVCMCVIYCHVYIYICICTCIYKYKQAGGPGSVLVKTTFFLMSLSLQRNAHLYKPNLAKFSRENLAKFAFREGFGHFSLDQFDRRFLLSFQSRRFSLEMFFCWGRACRFTHRH